MWEMVRIQGCQHWDRGTMDNIPDYGPEDSRGIIGELGKSYQERVRASEPQRSLLLEGPPM